MAQLNTKKVKTKKRSSLRFGPIFRPTLGEYQKKKKKKGLHSMVLAMRIGQRSDVNFFVWRLSKLGQKNQLNLIEDRLKCGSRSFDVVSSLQNSSPHCKFLATRLAVMLQLTVVAKTKFIQIIVFAARRVVFLLFSIFGAKASQTFIFYVYFH